MEEKISFDRKKSPFGLKDCISYAAGDVGSNMSFALKSTLSIFWTQYMRLDLWYALLLIIVQVWDAINDPIIGSVIDADKRRYKSNKFLAYISVGSIGLIIGGACCFLPIPNAPTWAKVIIFIAGYVIWDAFYTVTNVPYGSLLSLISGDVRDRASLSAWRSIGSVIGNMIPMLILPFIIYDQNNDLIGERVFVAALIMGVIGFVCFRFMIKNTVIRVEQNKFVSEVKKSYNIVSAFGSFLKNRAALGLTVAAMGMFIGMQGAATAITVVFQSYFKNVRIMGITQLFAILPIFGFAPFASRVVVRFGKKELAAFGTIFAIAAGACLFLIFPNDTSLDLVLFVIFQFVFSFGVGIYSTVSWAMMGDAIDYNEWRTGRREEGTVYSLYSFFRKLAQGIGPSVILIIMSVLGYVGKNEGNQFLEVAVNMRYLVAATYLFSAIIQFIGIGLIYDLDKKAIERMNKGLGR